MTTQTRNKPARKEYGPSLQLPIELSRRIDVAARLLGRGRGGEDGIVTEACGDWLKRNASKIENAGKILTETL